MRKDLVALTLAMSGLVSVAAAVEPYPIPTTGQEPQRLIPGKLVDLALRRASAYRGQNRSWYLYAYIGAYRDFLLVAGDAYNRGTLDVQRAGFQQGIADARSGATSVSPEDFGYTKTRVEGRFVIEFEGNRFHPIGSDALESALAFRMGRDMSRDEIVEGQNYLVDSWLSPEGRWGHMGAFKREIIVLGLAATPKRAS